MHGIINQECYFYDPILTISCILNIDIFPHLFRMIAMGRMMPPGPGMPPMMPGVPPGKQCPASIRPQKALNMNYLFEIFIKNKGL